jgi:hypothetical protein
MICLFTFTDVIKEHGSMSNTTIIDIEYIACEVAKMSEQIVKEACNQKVVGITGLTKQQAQGYTAKRFDDLLSLRMHWASEINDAKIVWDHYHSWYQPNSTLDELCKSALDIIDGYIRDELLVIIPEKSWSIWYVKQIGNSLVFEEGEDFRIADWERRMSSGEWQDWRLEDIPVVQIDGDKIDKRGLNGLISLNEEVFETASKKVKEVATPIRTKKRSE